MTNDAQCFRRILATIKDPTAGVSPALAKAALITQASGAELTLFHAIDLPICADAYASGARTLEDDRFALRRDFLEALEALARPLRAEGLEVRSAAEWDYPAAEAILRFASQSGADLIVTDHRHSREAALWPARPTDWQLLRLSSIPLLIVKHRPPYPTTPILAAVDPFHRHAKPADLSRHICHLAQCMSTVLGCGWHVLHASRSGRRPWPDTAAEAASEVEGDLSDRPRDVVEEMLRSIAAAPAQVHVLSGGPAEAIQQVARRLNSPLVVIGAVSRSGLPRVLIGNTAERLIDELFCDILIVKPEGFGIRYAQQVRGMKLYTVLETPSG